MFVMSFTKEDNMADCIVGKELLVKPEKVIFSKMTKPGVLE